MTISNDQISQWMAQADGGVWRVTAREAVESFQQSMERVTLTTPGGRQVQDVFLRVYQGYMSWWTLMAPDLPEREYLAAQAARAGGVPVAETIFRSREPEAAILRRVPGEPGHVPKTEAELTDFLETLCRLQRTPVSDALRECLPDVRLPVLLPRLRRWAEEAGDSDLQREVEAMALRVGDVEELPPVLLHGDLHPGNLVADAGRITAIIDWEEAAFGDPRLDAAFFYPAIYRRASPELAAVYLRQYEERTGIALRDPGLWLELTDLRTRIGVAWVKQALAEGRPLPSARPEAWLTL